jgi:hypothetical protein
MSLHPVRKVKAVANSIFKQADRCLWKIVDLINLALRTGHWFKYNPILEHLRVLNHRVTHHYYFVLLWILHLTVYVVLWLLNLFLLKHSVWLCLFWWYCWIYWSICFFEISLNISFLFLVFFLQLISLNRGRISINRFGCLFKIWRLIKII